MFLGCSYFFTKSEANVPIDSVLKQNTACKGSIVLNQLSQTNLEDMSFT